jgi:cytochrome d ubiquinol oxidase subunit I
MDDVFLLSRIQFALTIMFHYLFPPLSIGLGAIMVLMEGTYLRTGNVLYHHMTRFWSRIFAVNFAIGVASGIVMEFQFGTNWARYSRYVGDVFGSALAAEGIFAFFLESGFLAVLVFGWDRVSKRMHFFATLMVALGSLFSAVWIVVANSWMQTPAGYDVEFVTNPDGTQVSRAVITDFWAVVFCPSSMPRLGHVVLGAFLQGAFFVMSISAYYVLRNRHLEFAKGSFTFALIFGGVSSLAMAVSGHRVASGVAVEQPAALAALEGHFKTGPAPVYLFGMPDPESKEVKMGIAIPGGLSFLVHGDRSKPVPGLDHFPPGDRPPDDMLRVIFTSYHLMIGIGTLLIILSVLGMILLWRGVLFQQRWLMWVFVVAVLGPIICNQSGWVAAEVGRQPFIVYPEVVWKDADTPVMNTTGARPGLRTRDGLSSEKAVSGVQVLQSIVMFSVVYLLLLIIWVYVLNSKIQHGPDEAEHVPAGTTGDLLAAAAANKPAGGESLTRVEETADVKGGT